MPFPSLLRSSAGRPARPAAWLLRCLALALACHLAGLAPLPVDAAQPLAPLLWGPVGIVTAALLRWGPGLWPGALLGLVSLLLTQTSAGPIEPGQAPLLAAAVVAGPLAAALALRRLQVQPALDRLRDLMLYVGLAVMAGPALMASLLALLRPGADPADSAISLWLGFSSAGLLIGPLLLRLDKPHLAAARVDKRWREQLPLFVALLASCGWVFFLAPPALSTSLLFVPGVALVWLASRSSSVVTALATLCVGVLAGLAVDSGGLLAPAHGLAHTHPRLGMLWSYVFTHALFALLTTQVQDIVRASERRLRGAARAADLGLWEWHAEANVVSPIGHWPAMFGSAGNTPEADMHPDDLAQHHSRLRAHLRGDTDLYQVEYRRRGPGDQWVWVLVRGKVLARDGNGRPTHVAGTMQDISARKAMEEALRLGEQRLRTMFDGSTAAQLITDGTSGCIVDVNPAACRWLGRERGELIGQPIAAVCPLPPVDGPPDTRSRASLADGSSREVETHVSRIQTPHGEQVHAIVHDVTARMQAERALLTAEQLYRSTVESMRDVVFVCELDGRLTFLNAAWTTLTGHALAASLGRSLGDFLLPEQRLRALERIADLAAGSRDPDAATRTLQLLRADGSHCPVEINAGSLCDDRGQPISLTGTITDVSARLRTEADLRLAASVFRHSQDAVALTDARGRVIDVNDALIRITGQRREDLLGQPWTVMHAEDHSAGIMPALLASLRERGTWQGDLELRRLSGAPVPTRLTVSTVRDEDGRPTHNVATMADMTYLQQHQLELQRIAHYDALTGLPNRVLLADRMQVAIAQAQRSGQVLAVGYLDLDGFKEVNDRLGHAAGDQLLVALANRMKEVLRSGDTLARLGGDEFVLLLASLDEIAGSQPVLQRLLAEVSREVRLADSTVTVSASIGLACFPRDGAEADALLRKADQAMYEAKQAGKNRWQLFDPEPGRQVQTLRWRRERLRHALRHGELLLHYQPQVDLARQRVLGVEALIRWQHPEQGLLLPGQFLTDLDDPALEAEIGEWVIDTALAQAGIWRALGLSLAVSVNIAADHLERDDFVPRLRALLQARPMAAARLELEVLESAALKDVERVVAVIGECQALGVRFALDDFGTGYSSLAYLRRLPAQTLKIDRSFVIDMLHSPGDRTLVEGIVALARAFDRQVVAEGVESLAHGQALLQMGCHIAQGFGIARPMPAQALPAWVADWHGDSRWALGAVAGLTG